MKYIITFSGIFEYGYVKLVLLQRSKEKQLNGIHEGKSFATKFRCKWIADLMCSFMNWHADKTCSLRTYKVIKYE